VDDNVFDDSFDEDEEDADDVDGGYDENLEPLAEGVQNPFDDDNLAQDNGQEAFFNDPSNKPAREAAQSAQSSDQPLTDAKSEDLPNFPTPQVPQEKEYTSAEPVKTDEKKEKVLKDLDFGFGAGNLEPMPNAASSTSPKVVPEITFSEDSSSNNISGSNQGGPGFAAAVSPSNNHHTEEKPATTHDTTPVVIAPEDPGSKNDLDFGFGPTSFPSVDNQQPRNAAQPSESTKLNDIVNLLGDIDFSMGPSTPQDPATSTDNALPLPDLNFDFGDLPAIPGVMSNDPFSNLSSPPIPSGNIAELDFGTLDSNFFDNLESLDGKNQPAGGQGVPSFDTDFGPWGDNTTL